MEKVIGMLIDIGTDGEGVVVPNLRLTNCDIDGKITVKFASK